MQIHKKIENQIKYFVVPYFHTIFILVKHLQFFIIFVGMLRIIAEKALLFFFHFLEKYIFTAVKYIIYNSAK